MFRAERGFFYLADQILTSVLVCVCLCTGARGKRMVESLPSLGGRLFLRSLGVSSVLVLIVPQEWEQEVKNGRLPVRAYTKRNVIREAVCARRERREIILLRERMRNHVSVENRSSVLHVNPHTH